MNLYLIGNGFDLDLGFDTSYYSFIKGNEFKILTYNNSSNSLAKYINEQVCNSLSRWADLEILIGTYANEICTDEPDILKEHLNEIKAALKIYLSRQQVKYDIIQQKQSSAFKIIEQISSDIKLNIKIAIVNFNYTNTIIERLNYLNIENGSKENRYEYYHPHGKLNDDFAFGLNDGFLKSVGLRYSFLKKGYSDSYNLNSWPRIYQKVSNITIFGHSLGITDSDIINPMFEFYSKDKSTSRIIKIYDRIGNEESVKNRIDILVNGKINTFKLSNRLLINSGI